MNRAFSKIWILVIALILLAGGILAWQYFGVPSEEVKVPEKTSPEEIPKDETADVKFLKQSPLFTEYKDFSFGPSGTAIVLIEQSNYGPPFDSELYQLKVIEREFCQPREGECGQHLFAKSRKTNLKEYLGKKIGISYRAVMGIIMGEQQFVIVDQTIRDITDETADWKTYRNEEYEFEIKYPGDWIAEKDTDIKFGEKKIVEAAGNITVFKVGLTIKYYQDKSKLWGNEEELLPLEEWVSKHFLLSEEGEIKKVITFGIGNYQGILVEGYKLVGVIKLIPRIFTQRGDAIYEFEGEIPSMPTSGEFFPTDYDYDKVFEQMLSTFRFLEPAFISPKETEQWKIEATHTIKINQPVEGFSPFTHLTLNKSDGEEIGIISCKIGGSGKTIFNWDTKTVLNYCGAGLEGKIKEIEPGTYMIAITKDVEGRPIIASSELFSIVPE
jgi:hypothetical protein